MKHALEKKSDAYKDGGNKMAIKKIAAFILIIFAVFTVSPLYAEASSLESSLSEVNVVGLPVPEITQIDAASGIIYLKTDGFLNDKTDLTAVVSLKDGKGNLLETVEQKVGDPGNIRVSLKTSTIQSGYSIEAWFTNYGVQGDKTSQTHVNPPVILSIDIEEGYEPGLWGAFVRFFNKSAYNTKIKVTINAVDDLAIDKIYYCVTQGEDIPDDADWIETNGVLYFDNEMDSVIHAKATNKAQYVSGIVSKEIRIDRTPPVLTYELAVQENEYAPVVIRITATDDAGTAWFSGIDYIENPLGVRVQSDYIEYTVTENGDYSFKASDMTGNEVDLAVDIGYIIQITREDWEDNQPVIDAVLHATGKQKIEDVKYADLQGVTFLDLSSRSLSKLPYILRLALNLEYLDLRGNVFDVIPECVYELTKLRHLDLSNNNLTGIGIEISGLTKLETLDVSLNYLVDYDCPLVVDDYRNVGNFTRSGQANQYYFSIADTQDVDELIGNTVQINVNWLFDGQPIERIEDHRKTLYMGMYPQYRTYRPLLYKYEVQNGQIKATSADYVQVFLSNTGVMSATLRLGGTAS